MRKRTKARRIDATAGGIAAGYDSFGRLSVVESLDGSQTVLNAVEFRYNDLWQLTDAFQDHAGAVEEVNGVPQNDTRLVQYVYDDEPVATGNFSRMSRLVYPDGSTYDYEYGAAAGDLNDMISRVSQLRIDSGVDPTARYSFVGGGMFAQVDYVTPDVQLDRTLSHDGKRRTQGYATQASGVYPGWDQFGRVARQAWADGALTTNIANTPSRPPLVEIRHAYDNASNRLARLDRRPRGSTSIGWANRDVEYLYDELDRLQEAKRGAWNFNTGTFAALGAGSQQWDLDMLGNWSEFGEDLDADGSYVGVSELEPREHNEANEIVDRTVGGNALPFAYDDAGNLRTEAKTPTANWKYTHDAWNRLVAVDAAGYARAEYEYNGLHWRTAKRAATSAPFQALDEERVMYYSADWRLLQEDIDDGWSPGGPRSVDQVGQQFWGVRYIDDALARRIDRDANGSYDDAVDDTYYYLTDAQFSVDTIIDTIGVIRERVTYDAYGEARHHWPHDLDGDGDGRSANDIAIFQAAIPSAIGGAGYNPDCDVDRDGDVDNDDLAFANALYGSSYAPALPAGRISHSAGPDSSVGYDGYIFNAETLQYLVRFRNYDPVTGRWLERDPLSYVDGANLYSYVSGLVTALLDPFGLSSDLCGYDLQVTENYNDSYGPRVGGRRTIRRHFNNKDGEYLGYVQFDPCDDCDLARMQSLTDRRTFLNAVGRGAAGAVAIGETGIQMAGVAWFIAPDPSDPALAAIFGTRMLQKMGKMGAQLVRRNGKWFWQIGKKADEIVDPRVVGELGELHRHHLLAQKHDKFFKRHGINIDDLTRPVPAGQHNRKGGLHCKKDCDGKSWMDHWDEFVDADDGSYSREDIFKFARELDERFR